MRGPRKKLSELSRVQLRNRLGLYPLRQLNEEEGNQVEVVVHTPVTFHSTHENNTSDRESVKSDIENELNFEEAGLLNRESSSSEIEPEGYNESEDLSLRDDLAQWSLKHNVPMNAVTALLKLLWKHNLAELPVDGRTLLETPRETNILSMIPGEYCHFGLQNGIRKIVRNYSHLDFNLIRLQVNVDGLPISKSSGKQFWPILCNISNLPTHPFPVGIYCGNSKPDCPNSLMQHFVDEVGPLLSSGVEIDSRHYVLHLEAFICDAPAKSFIKCIKGHAGYSSCGSCKVVGEYVENRVVFCDVSCERRTDAEYRQLRDELSDDTHKLRVSVLENLPIDMVKQFPHDYMHLVCLGVMRKLLLLWLRGRDKRFKLSSTQIDSMSSRLEVMKGSISSDFTRKPRCVRELDRWKATELRLFLLYTGPVVLRGVLHEEVYSHFLTLHMAIRILCSSHYLVLNDYARDLLSYFVQCFQSIYGKLNMSFNIHGLLHISDDAKNLGPLDSFSAFKFENKLYEFKRLLKSSRFPLQQIHRRLTEKDKLERPRNAELWGCINPHNATPLPPSLRDCVQYERLTLKEIELSIKGPDSYCILKNNSVIKITNFLKRDSVVTIRGRQYQKKEDVFSTPISSSKFQIFLCSQLSEVERSYPVTDFAFKCLALPSASSSHSVCVFPILHTV